MTALPKASPLSRLPDSDPPAPNTDESKFIPERAEVYDPERKPPEAQIADAVDGAGGSSETNARQSDPADGRRAGARGEDDGQTQASAAGAGGSPVFHVKHPSNQRVVRKITRQLRTWSLASQKAWRTRKRLEAARAAGKGEA